MVNFKGRAFRGLQNESENSLILDLSLDFEVSPVAFSPVHWEPKQLKEFKKGGIKWNQILSSYEPEYLIDCLRDCFKKIGFNILEDSKRFNIKGDFLIN